MRLVLPLFALSLADGAVVAAYEERTPRGRRMRAELSGLRHRDDPLHRESIDFIAREAGAGRDASMIPRSPSPIRMGLVAPIEAPKAAVRHR